MQNDQGVRRLDLNSCFFLRSIFLAGLVGFPCCLHLCSAWVLSDNQRIPMMDLTGKDCDDQSLSGSAYIDETSSKVGFYDAK